jgi:Na+/proline symporter
MNATATVFIVYMLATIAITFYSGYKTNKMQKEDSQTSDAYLLAGRSLIWPVILLGTFGAAVGGTATVGAVGNVYVMGISAAFYGFSRGSLYIFDGIVAHKIRATKATNPAQMFGAAFTSKDAIFYTFVMGIALLGATTAQIMAAASVIPVVFPEVSMPVAMTVCAILFGGITLIGGFLSMNLTNIVNSSCILIGMVGALIGGLHLAGGWAAVTARTSDPATMLSVTNGGFPVIMMIAFFISQGPKICESGDWLGVKSAKTDKDARAGFVMAGLFQYALAVLVGFIGIIAVVTLPDLPAQDIALSALSVKISPIIGALCICGIYAAATSCAQGWFLSAANIFFNVLVKATKKTYTAQREVVILKVLVVICTVACWLMAMTAKGIVTYVVNMTTVTLPFAACAWLLYYGPKYLRKSSCTWMFILNIIVFFAWFLVPALPKIFPHLVFPMLIACAIGFVIPLCTDKHMIDPRVIYTEEYLKSPKCNIHMNYELPKAQM